MFAIRDLGLINSVNLNLDASSSRREEGSRFKYQFPVKNMLKGEDIFTHVNLQALERLGDDNGQAGHLRFTVVPLVNAFKGEPNWKVIVDAGASDRERSAIEHAALNVQRIFNMVDGYQDVRALIV